MPSTSSYHPWDANKVKIGDWIHYQTSDMWYHDKTKCLLAAYKKEDSTFCRDMKCTVCGEEIPESVRMLSSLQKVGNRDESTERS